MDNKTILYGSLFAGGIAAAIGIIAWLNKARARPVAPAPMPTPMPEPIRDREMPDMGVNVEATWGGR